MKKPNLSPQQHQSDKNPPTTATTAQETSAGEFIYNTMLPQSTVKSSEVPLSFGPGKTGHSQRSMMSVDLRFQSDDFDFVATGDGGVQISNAKPSPVTSSDFVAQNFLFTAKQEPLNDMPRPRPLKLERVSTGDSILKDHGLHDGRITSSDWKMEEFRDESSYAMKQLLSKPKPPCIGTLCVGMQRMSTADGIDSEGASIPNRAPVSRLPSDMSADWIGDFGKEQAAPLGPVRPSLFDEKENSDRKLMGMPTPTYTVPLAQAPPTASSTRQSTKNSSSSKANKSSKKKKKAKRVIDEGRICVPNDNDILFGRGGYTNTHPGNIRFREKALEFRPVYERSSKEEKYNISQMLLEAVTSEGSRFLEKGQDGEWHQVIGNGARKKASQALRERMKGTPRRKGSATANLTSSLTSVKSVNSQSPEPSEAYFVQEINGDTGDIYAV
mmetsp:Transcript_24988/g.39248  ORF Transcript_24988/g.39248 Transcript_24988/m.39248 type:complete len:441 (+) Transcript_24988:182-1504(+)